MTQIVVEIPTLGLVSALGRGGQEEAIFGGILTAQGRIDFFTAPTIMSNDPIIVDIAAQTGMTVNDIIGPFGAYEDLGVNR